MRLRFVKGTILMLSFLILLTATGLRPAHAVDKSRVFIWLTFVSGLGSTAAGAILQSQANEAYDEYLHTASQAEMDRLIDDSDSKHEQSIIASRTGLGLAIGAILLSLIDAAYIPPPETEKTPVFFSSEYGIMREQSINARAQNGDLLLTVGRKF